MSVRPHARTTALLVGAPVLALVLSGCGAGFQANTYANRNLDDAANTQVGAEIVLRNVHVVSPEEGIVHPDGGDAQIEMSAANNGPEPDRLVSITTDAATSASVVANGRRLSGLDVPPTTLVNDIVVELSELTRPLRSGEVIDVTVRFERAGERTFVVPVGGPTNPGEKEHSDVLHKKEE